MVNLISVDIPSFLRVCNRQHSIWVYHLFLGVLNSDWTDLRTLLILNIIMVILDVLSVAEGGVSDHLSLLWSNYNVQIVSECVTICYSWRHVSILALSLKPWCQLYPQHNINHPIPLHFGYSQECRLWSNLDFEPADYPVCARIRWWIGWHVA